jgi:hypothetical protein
MLKNKLLKCISCVIPVCMLPEEMEAQDNFRYAARIEEVKQSGF